MSGGPLIEAADLRVEAGGRVILDGVSLELHAGELIGVIGPNGAGKSTLLRQLARVAEPSAGKLAWRGRPYALLGRREFAARLGYLEQQAAVHWPLRVDKVVALGRLPHRESFRPPGREDREAVAEAVGLCGIGHLLERSALELSAGERMLVALARLLAGRPDAALADEPVAALDPRHQLLIMQTFRALARDRGLGALLVLHDLGLAARFCDRLVLLHQGRVAAAGAPADVLSEENLARCYGIRAEVNLDGPHAHVTPLHLVNG